MKFKKLGNTNLNVSSICLGTMTWGTQNSEKDAFQQMDYSLDQGVNFFDTAELYSIPPTAESYGKTEVMIGNWFEKRKNRNKIILATKIAGPGLDWIRGGKNSFDEKGFEEASSNPFSSKLFLPPLIQSKPGPAIFVAKIILFLFFLFSNQFPIITSVFPYDSAVGGIE